MTLMETKRSACFDKDSIYQDDILVKMFYVSHNIALKRSQ